MTEAQSKRVETFRRTHSVRGVIEHDDGTVQVGYERNSDGRDRELTIDTNGRTIENRDTWGH